MFRPIPRISVFVCILNSPAQTNSCCHSMFYRQLDASMSFETPDDTSSPSHIPAGTSSPTVSPPSPASPSPSPVAATLSPSPSLTSSEPPVASPVATTGSPSQEAPFSPSPSQESGSPSPSPSPAPSSPECFSGETIVQVEDKGITRMDQLQIGDAVLVKDGYFSEVYSFGHYDPEANTTFIQILTDDGKYVEVTADHLLFMYTDEMTTTLTPAMHAVVGSLLLKADENRVTQVQSICTVERRGAYAPFTKTGDIVVGGVVASCYVALPPAFSFSYGQQHWMQHAAYSPYRIFCDVMGGCENEHYDKTSGLSKAVSMWLPVLGWLERHPIILQGVMLLSKWNKRTSVVVLHAIVAIFGYLSWKRMSDKNISK